MRFDLRIACTIAATFILHFNLLQPALASVKKHTAVSSVKKQFSLTPAQKNAAESALKSLRKLGAATEVGVTLSDYHTRLIDTKSDVDECLRILPSGKLKTHINNAIQAYLDASTFWDECEKLKSRKSISEGVSGSILAKYHLTMQQNGQKEIEARNKAEAESDNLKQIYSGDATEDQREAQRIQDRKLELLQESVDDSAASLNIDEDDKLKILTALWKNADHQVQEAEAAQT